MSYAFSDSDSKDSDSGIRYKTASTRHKSESSAQPSQSRHRSHARDTEERERRERYREQRERLHRRRSETPEDERRYKKSRRGDRSRSRERLKQSRDRNSREGSYRSRSSRSRSKSKSVLKETESSSSSRSKYSRRSDEPQRKQRSLPEKETQSNKRADRCSKTSSTSLSSLERKSRRIKTDSESESDRMKDRSINNDDMLEQISSSTSDLEVSPKIQTYVPKKISLVRPQMTGEKNGSGSTTVEDEATRTINKTAISMHVTEKNSTKKDDEAEKELPRHLGGKNPETIPKSDSLSPKQRNVTIGPQLPPNLAKKFENDYSSDDSLEVIGPVLPASAKNNDWHKEKSARIGPETPQILRESPNSKSVDKSEENAKDGRRIGPELPPHLRKSESTSKTYGPTLPPSMGREGTSSSPADEVKSKSSVIGPELPPHLMKSKVETSDDVPVGKYIGPALPPHLRRKLDEEEVEEGEQASSSDDDEAFGPMPEGQEKGETFRRLEERALEIKLGVGDSAPDVKKREEWMLELPQVRAANLGLGPRSFRTKEAPDFSDRSEWTDTPQDKERKKGKPAKEPKEVDLKQSAEKKRIKERDKQQEEAVESYKKKKKRDKSLLELHQDKLKAEKKSSDSKTERRPFSRDVDLQVNRFDEAQKQSIIKKSQLLNSRFAQGESKFL